MVTAVDPVSGVPWTREDTRDLFALLQSTGDSRYRDALVHLHLPLVEYLAKRFKDRGEPLDDLVQVGSLGLIKAIDRFDLERGVEFSTYATPTIVGELKRHFRDKGWAIRVPRRLQELSLKLNKTTTALAQKLGRSPTVAELARELGETEDAILEAMESSHAYSTTSLDAPTGDEDSPTRGERLGGEDERLENLEYFASLAPIIAELGDRERDILSMRFFRGMTQLQIAEAVGISQMHVSRQLARTLRFLRNRLDDPDATF